MRRVCFLGCAGVLAAALANAQSTVSPSPSGSAQFSSSAESSSLQLAESVLPDSLASLPSAPAPEASGGGQTESGWRHKALSNYALEFGGGFNGPSSNSSPYITWGGQFTVGGGHDFSNRLAVLAEFQLIDDKLPGALIAETGASGGHAHIWSLTLDPVVSLFPKATNDIYLTGGGGFYRKVTSFTDPEEAEYCDYYYCGVETVNQVVGHFSSNQGGWSIGGGYQRRMGGMYHDSRMKLFAEARYLDVMTPAVESNPNGLGTTTVAAGTKVVPVTLGVRW
jgi:hypothetical protein